jgi:hypothetical protein
LIRSQRIIKSSPNPSAINDLMTVCSVCREELCRHAVGQVSRTADHQDDVENARTT